MNLAIRYTSTKKTFMKSHTIHPSTDRNPQGHLYRSPLKFLLITALFLGLFFSPGSLSAQPDMENPVHWSSSTSALSADTFRVTFTAKIDLPWHLYDLGPYENGPNPTAFTFAAHPSLKPIGEVVQATAPTRVHDEMFGMTIGYFAREAVFTQDFQLVAPATGAKLTATVEWMACDDSNCLPPSEQEFTLLIGDPAVAAADNSAATAPSAETSASTATPTIQPSETGSGSLWASIIEAILWGFAALLTPCVFPMVPMTVSFFMKSSENKSRGRFMAMLYGISIVALYTVPIAIIILVSKVVGGEAVTADIFNWLATHWVPNVIFFLVFMIFAASFFGAFEITMPSWLVNKSDQKADKGGIIGLFFMALTLVLVSFSCTGPIVGSVLIKSTSGEEVWGPVITMLAFSSAFALPFTLFAFFPSLLKNLPKSGGWLNSVKVVLGFLELALGLKFLSVADQTYHWGILDREIYLALWIVIFSLLGFYLLGKLRFKYDSETQTVGVPRLILAIISFSFVVYMIPGMWGAPLRGLSGYLPPLHTQDFVLDPKEGPQASASSTSEGFPVAKYSEFLSLPHGLHGFFDYAEAAEYARRVGKPLFVDYTGHGCVNCREMEARVWSDPQVLERLRRDFVIVALYSDDKKTVPESDWVTTESGKVLKGLGKINAHFAHKQFGINSQPYYLILDDNGKPLVPGRGYNLDIDAFNTFLKEGAEQYQATK